MSISKDEKLGTYIVQVWYRDALGERRKKTHRGHKTKADARRWEADFLASCKGRLEMRFDDFIKTYYQDVSPRLKPGTKLTKEAIIDKYLLPYFGEMRMCDIVPADIVRWENQLLARDLSDTYLHTVCNQLSAVFNHAVRFYRLPSNPVLVTGKVGSKKPTTEMSFWTTDEFEAFIEALADKPESYHAFMLLYWTGIREGELLALRPMDFDFERGLLMVRRSYSRIKGKDVIGTPKTRKSRRDVLMPDFLRDEMEDYLSTLPDLELEERIFTMTKHKLAAEMKRGCALTGVKRIRIHDIRHSHVSLLINLGFSANAIADRMGHESAEITENYSHLFPSTQRSLVDALNEVGRHE